MTPLDDIRSRLVRLEDFAAGKTSLDVDDFAQVVYAGRRLADGYERAILALKAAEEAVTQWRNKGAHHFVSEESMNVLANALSSLKAQP